MFSQGSVTNHRRVGRSLVDWSDHGSSYRRSEERIELSCTWRSSREWRKSFVLVVLDRIPVRIDVGPDRFLSHRPDSVHRRRQGSVRSSANANVHCERRPTLAVLYSTKTTLCSGHSRRWREIESRIDDVSTGLERSPADVDLRTWRCSLDDDRIERSRTNEYCSLSVVRSRRRIDNIRAISTSTENRVHSAPTEREIWTIDGSSGVYRTESYPKPCLEDVVVVHLPSPGKNAIFLTNIFTFIEPTSCAIVSIVFSDAASNETGLESGGFLRIAPKEAFAGFTGEDTEMITRTGIITDSTRFGFVRRRL